MVCPAGTLLPPRPRAHRAVAEHARDVLPTAVPREVFHRIGIVTDQGITVIEGLSGNEKVVLRAGGFLSPGEVVRPQLAPKPSRGE